MKGNYVVVFRDENAEACDPIMAEYGTYQTRLSSTTWMLDSIDDAEELRESILARLGKHATVYVFETSGVAYNTVDSDAGTALRAQFPH
ncbi:hypothetical protein [Robbsia andropogonis]|uniref:hypothetical protein n=1 Tax=Robbsia andropogonis TaxID=28092 RepID=UPI00046399ED|nr:hypothetical protein [Robbsia andropogonis]MCP1116663.1 hypothetical protein [Robbsia andropogonis]MCP1126658.1 hypothetical protein [Robbsia andropogonis]